METWKLTLNKLLTESCLVFGQYSKSTSKNVARYLLGARQTTEIFKLYEMRYLLLKTYPLIHNLFHNPRVNPNLELQQVYLPNTSEPLSLPKLQRVAKWPFRQRFSFIVKQKNIPPQILFASATPLFSQIIHNAAKICNMPWHENRWLNGTMTAALSNPSGRLTWEHSDDRTQKKIFQKISTEWNNNKQNEEKIKEKFKHYSSSRWPSLIVIPDISNNMMILKEARKVGLPVMGLVNSNCSLEIDYPIFAQNQSLQSIQFFCHFLATLIAKETVSFQHKRYTLQKALCKTYKTKKLTNRRNGVFSSKKKKLFTLEQAIASQKSKGRFLKKKPFFFKVVLPQRNKSFQRYFVAQNFMKYRPRLLKKINHRLNKKYKSKKSKWKISKKIKWKELKKMKLIETTWKNAKYKKRWHYKNTNALINYLKKIKKGKLKTDVKKKKIKHKTILSFKNTTHKFHYSGKYVKRPTVLYVMMKYFSNHHKRRNNFFEHGSFVLREKEKLFHKEYQKKYLKKKIHTNEESKQVKHTLRNFLLIDKISHLWRISCRRISRTRGFTSTPPYFRLVLQRISQHMLLQNMIHGRFPLTRFKIKKKKKPNSRDVKITRKNKYFLFLKYRTKHELRKLAWKAVSKRKLKLWLKKNQPILTHKKIIKNETSKYSTIIKK